MKLQVPQQEPTTLPTTTDNKHLSTKPQVAALTPLQQNQITSYVVTLGWNAAQIARQLDTTYAQTYRFIRSLDVVKKHSEAYKLLRVQAGRLTQEKLDVLLNKITDILDDKQLEDMDATDLSMLARRLSMTQKDLHSQEIKELDGSSGGTMEQFWSTMMKASNKALENVYRNQEITLDAEIVTGTEEINAPT